MTALYIEIKLKDGRRKGEREGEGERERADSLNEGGTVI